MANRLFNVGLDNQVSTNEIVAIAQPDSLPLKQLINAAEANNRLIDLTRGRKRRSMIVTKSGYVLLSPLRAPTLAERYSNSD
ncbi:MAG: extracellular matrix/biofilm biosynthesis regulator RemA family protein [Candidatus Bipolaricaulia bacterium]